MTSSSREATASAACEQPSPLLLLLLLLLRFCVRFYVVYAVHASRHQVAQLLLHGQMLSLDKQQTAAVAATAAF
jgi:hypothetical protein